QLRIEAERDAFVVVAVDRRHLSIAGVAKAFEDVRGPLDGVEDTYGALRVDDPLRQRGHPLLEGAPRAGRLAVRFVDHSQRVYRARAKSRRGPGASSLLLRKRGLRQARRAPLHLFAGRPAGPSAHLESVKTHLTTELASCVDGSKPEMGHSKKSSVLPPFL